MKRLIFFSWLVACCFFTCKSQPTRFSFTESKMGSPFTIIFYHNDAAYASATAAASFQLVDSFVNIFSDYIPESELNRLSNSSGKNVFVQVTPAMYDILTESQTAYRLSKGAFDITIGPLSTLWRSARKQQLIPSADSIASKKASVGFDKIKIDHQTRSVMLMKEGMRLDLGGIAQGYIAGKVLTYLAANGIRSALVDVSGDIALGAEPTGKKGWTIGVNLPETTDSLQRKKLLLHDCTVSTSGDVYQYLSFGGKKYSHILDPRTGYGVTTRKNVTVIARDATTADWLATACSIVPFRQARKLAAKVKAEVMVATIRKGNMTLRASKGFKKNWQ